MSNLAIYSEIDTDRYTAGEIIRGIYGWPLPGELVDDPGSEPELDPDTNYVVGAFDRDEYFVDLSGTPTATLRPGPQPAVDKTTALVGEEFTFTNCDPGSKFMIQASDDSATNLFALEEEFAIEEDIILFASPEPGIFDIRITSTWPEKDFVTQITVTET